MMGKLKDYIIKKLGGMTRAEFEKRLRLARAFDCRPVNVVPLVAKHCFTKEEWDLLDEVVRERIAKAELVRNMSVAMEPFLEIQCRQGHADWIELSATLRVVPVEIENQ